VLTSLVDQILEDRPHLGVGTDTAAVHGVTQLQHTLGQLAARGVAVDLDRLFAGGRARAVSLAALAEETRPAEPTATTWLVNGGSARPARAETKSPPPPLVEHASPPAAQQASPAVAQQASPTVELNGVHPPEAASDSTTQVMLEHQRLMEQFLQMHQQVMLAYLEGSTTPVKPPAPAPALLSRSTHETVHTNGKVHHIMPVAEVRVQPPELDLPSAPPTTAVPGREDIAHSLKEIVSERTGYPLDVLGLELDLEAELGIDSIKRVEVIGALRRKYVPQDVHIDSSVIEALASAKTLGTIVDTFLSVLQPQTTSDTISLNGQTDVPRFIVGAVNAGR
jgi:acyl carrier protein